MEKRLFHRYAANRDVIFQLGKREHSARLGNVSASGAFIASDMLPMIGSNIDIVVTDDESDASICLEMSVMRVIEPENGLEGGFGGHLIKASSQNGEAGASIQSSMRQCTG